MTTQHTNAVDNVIEAAKDYARTEDADAFADLVDAVEAEESVADSDFMLCDVGQAIVDAADAKGYDVSSYLEGGDGHIVVTTTGVSIPVELTRLHVFAARVRSGRTGLGVTFDRHPDGVKFTLHQA